MNKLPRSKTLIITISIIVVTLLAIVIPVSISLSNKSDTATYKITLDKQGGSGGTSSVTATIDTNMPKATAPNKSGYVFGGYYTETDGSGAQYYTSQMKSARKWDIKKDTTLYAYWISDGASVKPNHPSESTTQEGKSIVLSKSNFNNYFTYTHSVSIEPFTSNNPYITTTSAIYYYSAKPKVNIKTISSLPIINLTINVSFYKNTSDYSSIHSTSINISLYASESFQANNTWNMSFIPQEAKTYKLSVASVSGTIYVTDK